MEISGWHFGLVFAAENQIPEPLSMAELGLDLPHGIMYLVTRYGALGSTLQNSAILASLLYCFILLTYEGSHRDV